MVDIFADVDKAIDAKYGDNSSGAVSTDQAPDSSPKVADQAAQTSDTAPTNAQALLDLSKVEKFIFNGKETTLKELEQRQMFEADYRRKTQEIAEQRRSYEEQSKYASNFHADFQRVLENPSLAEEFKRLYPKEYHNAVDIALQRISPQQQSQQVAPSQDQLIQQIIDKKIGPIQSKLDAYETEKLTNQLDGIFTKQRAKFAGADEEFVLARLQTLKDQGVNITESKIEETFKYFHDKDQQSKEAYHKEQLNKQIEANKKGRDTPAGGGVPGQAPKKFSMNNTKEIEEAMIARLSGH